MEAVLAFPAWTIFEDVPARELLIAGVMVAVVASAETLVCATAVAGIWFVDWGSRAKTAVLPLPGGAALVTQGWF